MPVKFTPVQQQAQGVTFTPVSQASQGVTFTPIEPALSDEQVSAINERAAQQIERESSTLASSREIAERIDPETAKDWLKLTELGFDMSNLSKVEEDIERDVDLIPSAEEWMTAGKALKKFGKDLAIGGAKLAKSFAVDAVSPVSAPPEVVEQGPEAVKEYLAQSIIDRNARQKESIKSFVEGNMQNALSLGNISGNLARETLEFFGAIDNEVASELKAEIDTRKLDYLMQEGIVFDAKETDPQQMLAAGIVSDPVTAVLAPLKLAGAGSKFFRAIDRASPSLTRKAVKGLSKISAPVVGLGGKTKALSKPLDISADLFGAPVRLAGKSPVITSTLSLGSAGIIPAILGGAKGLEVTSSLASKLANKVGIGADKAKIWLEMAGRPDRQKRLLDIMATEHGSKLAANLSKYVGQKGFDVMFDALVTGTKGAVLDSAFATAENRSREEIIQAAGTGAGVGGVIGAALGERGAGASTDLIDPITGELTSRSEGSFKLASENLDAKRSAALAVVDQAKKAENLPVAVKAAMAEAQEIGALPNDVVIIDPKDYGDFLKAMNRHPGQNVSFDNAAMYFEGEDVLLLNGNMNLEGVGALRILGEEIAHAGMRNMFNDPSVTRALISNFEDKKGRSIVLDRHSISGETVKVNKALSNFIDAYNKEAAASGAPMIHTARQALMEFYGANAGIAMQGNKSQASAHMDSLASQLGATGELIMRRGVHAFTEKALNMLGMQPRDEASYAGGIDKAANTALGKHIQRNYQVWRDQSRKINAILEKELERQSANSALNPKQVAEKLRQDPAAKGDPKIRTFGKPKVSKKTEMIDLTPQGVGERKTNKRGKTTQIIFKGAIPSKVKEAWVNRFPKKERDAAGRYLDMVESDALNRQAAVFHYVTQTGRRVTGKPNRRYAVPEASFRINDNGQLFIQMRDMDAINANIRVARQQGRIGNKTDEQVRQEVLADLDRREQDPAFGVGDQTRAIMGEKRLDGKPLVGAWKGWTVDPNSARRSVKDFDVDGLMGYADAEGDALFGQPRAQEGLVFANPRKVVGEAIPSQTVPIGDQVAETGKPITFHFIRNTESAEKFFGKPKKGDQFDRDIEPAGRFMSPADRKPTSLQEGMESGEVTFESPIVIDGGQYRTPTSWKRILSNRFGGKSGKALSKAIVKDGFDGIITVDSLRSGQKFPSETVDLTMFK